MPLVALPSMASIAQTKMMIKNHHRRAARNRLGPLAGTGSVNVLDVVSYGRRVEGGNGKADVGGQNRVDKTHYDMTLERSRPYKCWVLCGPRPEPSFRSDA